MIYSQKYCLVQPIDSMQVGDEFDAKDWPLHVTIVGVFALDWSEDYFSELAQLVKSQQPFSARTDQIEYFGPEQQVKVRLVETNQQLQACHYDIAQFIVDRGGAFNDPQYHFDGFRPHATMRGDSPDENIEIKFDEFVLIDMFPDQDHTQRKIIKRFALNR